MSQKISIVTVCYNASTEIEKTMESVLSQSYENIEYIIIDGASTDDTLKVAKSKVLKYNTRDVKIFSGPDKGIFDAMNKGIKKATGEWINFMNAGDLFYNEKVIENLFKSEIAESTGVLFGDTYTEKGLFKMLPFIYNSNRFCEMGICHQSLFVRTILAKKYLFDLHFKVAADYNMIHKIYDAGFDFKYFNIPVSIYDMFGFSTQNVIRQVDEIAMICNVYHSFWHYRVRVAKQIKLMLKKILKK